MLEVEHDTTDHLAVAKLLHAAIDLAGRAHFNR